MPKKRTYCDACWAAPRALTLGDAKTDRTRRQVLERALHKCGTCGRSRWMGKKIPLELHHVDGDHRNNNVNNLQLICPNCHAQTSTYKNRNKGNGRAFRRESIVGDAPVL